MSYNDYENGKLDGYNEGYTDGYEHGQKDCKESAAKVAKEAELYSRISSIEDTLSRIILALGKT
jgi:flagellar biosynthesis/type III secretory pathway protein FliH